MNYIEPQYYLDNLILDAKNDILCLKNLKTGDETDFLHGKAYLLLENKIRIEFRDKFEQKDRGLLKVKIYPVLDYVIYVKRK